MAQTQVLAPQMRQSLKMLQLTALDLAAELRQQMQENPVIEDIRNPTETLISNVAPDDRADKSAADRDVELDFTPEGAAVIILKDEDKVRYDVREGDTEGFVNIPLAIASVRISLFLKEEEGLFRVSIRSRRDVSARNLATRFFHGGGHEQAAGGKVLIPGDIPSREEIDAYIQNILKGFKG